MATKKGFKLHSIIEKLSEQCVRVNPSEDSEDLDTEQIITVTAEPLKQRITRGNGIRKKAKKSYASKATNTESKSSLNCNEKVGSRKVETKDSCQQVDDDLCIDVNALMSIIPQVQDIDTANVAGKCLPLQQSSCSICQRVKGKEEFLEHLKDCHPESFKNLPLNYHTKEDGMITESGEGEEEVEQEDEEEESEEEIEESDESDHTHSDPDFDVEVDSDSDTDSDVSSDNMIVTTFPTVNNRKRRSRRIKAMKGSEGTEYESEESESVYSSDIYIDIEKFVNTSPKLEDIDLPKTKHFSCKLCSEKYYFGSELDNHFEESHPESSDTSSQTSWNCEHCSLEFFTKNSLLLHINEIVQKIEEKKRIQEEKRIRKEKENTCRHCGKLCKSNGSLKKHYLTHSDSRPFKCDICDRRFKDKNYVYRHKKTHSGIKKHECSYCKKMFTHSGSLRSHIMLHTGERPHKCQYCEAGFISKFDRKVHENKHTGNLPYKCPHCTKCFPKSNNLKVHLIAHSTEKPFPCEVCGKAFKRRDHLKYHLVIHSDDKPYKCDTCNKKFNQRICLRKHLPCRELEKLEKRANKPKENGSQKQQKVAKKSHKNKQDSDSGNTTGKSTGAGTTVQENNENSNDCFGGGVGGGDTAPELSTTYMNTNPAMTSNQQKSNDTETNQPTGQIGFENTELLACNMVNSVTTSEEKDYSAGTHDSPAVSDHLQLDLILNSTRQSHDSGLSLSSIMDRSHTNTTALPQCAIDKILSRTYTHPPEACVYTSSIQPPFVPFNCSSQNVSDMDFGAGALDLETLHPDNCHGNLLGNRSFPPDHESPNELSNALLAAMDPDNLSAMVESASAFFSPT